MPFFLRLMRWLFPRLEVLAPALAHWLFVRLFFMPFRYTRPKKEEHFYQSAERFQCVAAGKTIQCYSWGDQSREVVWVVHGWAGRATQFRKFIPPLVNAGFRVVGFDGPAHGDSEGRRTNILEFEEALRKLHEQTGPPRAVICHSFGGVALLYAMSKGLRVSHLINVASPTLGDEVISTYLRALNASPATGAAFKKWLFDRYGKTFDEFSGHHLIQQIGYPFSLLLVYDEDDQEVTIAHAHALRQVFPSAQLLQTQGLGHNRVLKDDAVVETCLRFINSPAKT